MKPLSTSIHKSLCTHQIRGVIYYSSTLSTINDEIQIDLEHPALRYSHIWELQTLATSFLRIDLNRKACHLKMITMAYENIKGKHCGYQIVNINSLHKLGFVMHAIQVILFHSSVMFFII